MGGTIESAERRAAAVAIAVLCTMGFVAGSAQAAAPLIESSQVVDVGTTTALFRAKINPEGSLTRYRFEYGATDCSIGPCASVPTVEGKIPAGSSSVSVSVPVEGLLPATVYHYRVVVKNPTVSEGPDHFFLTYGSTFEGLPDGRAYEQASPVDKDGGDVQGQQALVKASPDGSGISFGSAFGIPGGKGAQGLTTFLAGRDASSWSTQGLLPPVSVGERVRVIGWSPDYSRIYSQAIRLGSPSTEGLVEQSSQTQDLTTIGPYAADAKDSFAGETSDGSVVFFEAKAKLPPKEGGTPIAAATNGVPNLYAWSRESKEVHLAGVFNEGAPKGSFAGPYDWSIGSNAFNLHEGGGQRNYYLQGMRAITPDGDVYFTAAGSGQLYLRRNPTENQSPLSAGKCSNPELACTVHVSASKKTNGNGPSGTDPAGEQPAAFQAASQDGSQVFFTSPEKLTDNANTGPEQLPSAIARAKLNGETAEDVEAEFLLKRAVGVARFGPWLYWADPKAGTIGRAKLNGEEGVEALQPDFILVPPSEGKCEEEIKQNGESVFTPIAGPIPSEPRYLAVDSEHVYWTNTGRRDEIGNPIDGGGTIGRAKLNGENAEEIEPAFICGEEASQPGKRLVSNPQGIAVNATHIYWANAAMGQRAITRATIGGAQANAAFMLMPASRNPYGLVLTATDLYVAVNAEENNFSYVERATLEGAVNKTVFIGEDGLRGLTVDSGHLYWATRGEGGAIGRADLDLENRDNGFIAVEGAPNGIAAGATHLFWASNGDTSGNLGNDLYRYVPSTDVLTDLTPLVGGNGAEVQGVLGASASGSYVYFAANGILAAGATQGNCKGPVHSPSGKCNLYVWHEGAVGFVAPVDVNGNSDALNWVGSPAEVFNTGSYFQKTSFLVQDGGVLVFRSQERLTDYDNEGVPEFYLYRANEPDSLSCLTCRPNGESVGEGPRVGSVLFPVIQPANLVQATAARNLSADGSHFFFETPEALSPADTNGAAGCPLAGSPTQNYPACLDVYEWEAPGAGQCEEGGPSFSPLNEGCLYLISTGKSEFPSLFGDASEAGKDVFFFTRQRLVGQDKDELQDVYDARIGGGLSGQNQVSPPPCEGAEACRGPVQAPPSQGSPVTPTFVGPANPKPKHKKQQKKKKKKHTHHKKKQQRMATAQGRSAR
jgi:hypothetical protein